MLHTKYTSSLAFTLVELIVVIAILVVLSTIGFVGYSGYTSSSRDASRASDLKNIYQALKVSEANNGTVPEPDSAITIYSSTGVTLSRQGVIGENVRKSINLESGGRDPKESTPYTYLRFKDKRSVQLLALFENEGWEARLALENESRGNTYTLRDSSQRELSLPKGNGVSLVEVSLSTNSLLSEALAADYTDRFPVTNGKKLGVLVDNTNTPLNEIAAYTASGVNLGLSSVSTSTGIFVIGNSESNIKEAISGTGVTARLLSPSSLQVSSGSSGAKGTSASDAGISCKALKEQGGVSTDGLYWIKPDSTQSAFQAYCDMTTDGGGWTLVVRAMGDSRAHINASSVGTLTSPTQTTTAKLSDTMINAFSDKTVYRGSVDSSVSTYFDITGSFSSTAPMNNGSRASWNSGAWTNCTSNSEHGGLQAYENGGQAFCDGRFIYGQIGYYAMNFGWYPGGHRGGVGWGASTTIWVK